MTCDNGKIALPSSLGYLIITWYAKREEGYQSQARQILLATNKRADRLKQSIEGDIHDGCLQNAILVQRDKHLITSKHTWFAWNLHYVACPTVLGMSSNSEMCKDKFCNSFVWINSYETGTKCSVKMARHQWPRNARWWADLRCYLLWPVTTHYPEI